MKHLYLLLLCLLPLLASAQAPKPGLTGSKVCLPGAQAVIIFRSLRNYEKMKPLLSKTLQANQDWRILHAQDSTISEGKDRLIGWYKTNHAEEQQMRQDADRQVVLWKRKARKRGVIIGVGIGLPALYGGYTLYKNLL